MASLLDIFSDYQKSNESAYTKDALDIQRDITKNTYALAFFARDKEMAQTFQSGKDIKWYLELEQAGTAHFYKPGVTREAPIQVQTLSLGQANWRFHRNYMSWNNETLMLNKPGTDPLGHRPYIISVSEKMQGTTWIDSLNHIEDALMATPSYSEMEVGTGTLPYSLGTIITEGTPGTNLGTVPANWTGTTIFGIDASAKANWRNQTGNYASVGAISGTAPHLFVAMRKMYNKCRFDQLPMEARYADKRQIPNRIFCSLGHGQGAYVYSMQATSNFVTYIGGVDPNYPNPTFLGIPLDPISTMDAATIYPTGAANAMSYEGDTAGTTNAGPRYFFVNTAKIQPVFHSEMYFYRHDPQRDITDPSTWAQYIDTYYNILPISRRAHGIVYPSADITGFTGAA